MSKPRSLATKTTTTKAETSTRLRFFSGKGGVGKTTCAAATALMEAEAGHDVLVVSTDPAHSLGDALGIELSAKPREIAVAAGGRLRALELDADAALERWIDRRRVALTQIASRGTYLDDEDIDRFFRLSLPGVDELIALIEIEQLVGDLSPQRVIIDTAPTGHTLRMLEMPRTLAQIARVLDDMQEKHRVIATTLGAGHYQTDSADLLISEVEEQAQRVASWIRNADETSVVWICNPETLSVLESVSGVEELSRMSLAVERVIVNRVTPAPPSHCAICDPRRIAERRALGLLVDRIAVPVELLAASPLEPRGLDALRELGSKLDEPAERRRTLLTERESKRAASVWTEIPGRAATIEASDELAIVFVGGKGGVGKTSVASAIALSLAARQPDRRILLLSTDPAHSLGDALDLELGDVAIRVRGALGTLWARELDAPAELERRKADYRKAVDELFDQLRGGARLDATYDRAIVHDFIELAPPGIDEVFASLALLDSIFPAELGASDSSGYDLVVVDTAPWGHTERLLALPDSAREWVKTLISILLKYREVIGLGSLAEDLLKLSRALGRLGETWRDPARTVFVPVTRAAALPRLETIRLIRSLERMQIHVPAILVNGIRDAREVCSRCAVLANEDRREIDALSGDLGSGMRLFVAPLVPEPPRGASSLQQWARSWKVIQA